MTLKGMVLNTASSPFSASTEELLSSYADTVRAGTGGYLRCHCQGIDQGFYRSIKHVMWIKENNRSTVADWAPIPKGNWHPFSGRTCDIELSDVIM